MRAGRADSIFAQEGWQTCVMVKRRVVQNFAILVSDIGAKIVAESVEQNEDTWTAMQLGVDFVPGHLFGKATEKPNLMPLAESFWGAHNKLHDAKLMATMPSPTNIPSE